MAAYVILLVFIYTTYFITRLGSDTAEGKNQKFLVISFIAIYALCALRDYSVGRDISGYIDTYEMAGYYPFMDNSWTHMEVGYVTFMQICSMLGLNSRLYLCVVYALMIYPIYLSIKRFSKDPLLSTVIFICFQFLTFDLSGIRQGLALSICLMSLPYADIRNKKDLFCFVVFLFLAFTIHKSSVIFAIVPILLKLKLNFVNTLMSIIGLVIAPGLTSFFLSLNSESKYLFDDRLVMGGMVVFLFAILFFVLYSCLLNKKNNLNDNISGCRYSFSLTQYSFLLIAGMFFTLAFNGTMLFRSTMSYIILMAFAIPSAIKQYSPGMQSIITLTLHVVMLMFFYLFCLLPKTLDTVPYVLGSDILFLQ